MAEGEEQAQQVEKKGLTDAQLLERVYANESVRIEAMSNHTDTYREMRPEDAIARHGSLDDWSSYVDMLSGDAADSTTVLNLCRDEAWEAAYGRWSCMDTSPRDRSDIRSHRIHRHCAALLHSAKSHLTILQSEYHHRCILPTDHGLRPVVTDCVHIPHLTQFSFLQVHRTLFRGPLWTE